MGGGLVGTCTAWALQRRGHHVQLLDPALGDGGTWAALGVLMAQVFHRASGRGWRLRQRSLELWQSWTAELEQRGHAIPRRNGLLLLARNSEEEQRLRRLAQERQALGFPLELWDTDQLRTLQPGLPAGARVGLFSPADGQVDPVASLAAFRSEGERHGLSVLRDQAVSLDVARGGGWRVERAEGNPLQADALVLTAGLPSLPLLERLGFRLALEPVLGQALELELADAAADPAAATWPGVVAWRGVNLIPRPDRPGGRRLWLGASLEPGSRADPARLEELLQLHGDAPDWLKQASVVRRWQGIRPRPAGRPAPLLETLAPGLLLATGHYRNGVLLAPATADWVIRELEGG